MPRIQRRSIIPGEMVNRNVPAELRKGPFTLSEARNAGVTRQQLQSPVWRRVGHGLRAWADLGDSPGLQLQAVQRRLSEQAAFSGRTAAWLHDLGLPFANPVEVTIDESSPIAARAGIQVRKTALDSAEIVSVRGFRTTTVMRTVTDLGRTASLVEAVVATDVALNRGLVTLDRLKGNAALSSRPKGLARLYRALRHAEPLAESPMETRLRMLLVLAGLPRPEAQAQLFDDSGRLIGRADLLFRPQRLVLEYDGDGHRTNLVADDRRQNRLLSAGYTLLRYTAPDIYATPSTVIEQVRGRLAASG